MGSQHHPTRRQFLAAGAGGLAGAALLAACADGSDSHEAQPRPAALVRRTLGRTGLSVPIVGIGSAYEPSILRAALDAGLTYVHTSGSYAEANHERLVGRILRGRPRDSFVIGSSPDLPYRFEGPGPSEDLGTAADPSAIEASLTASLERLGLDYVDIFFLASLDERATVLHEPYVKAFERLKRSGRARFIGVGTHRNEPTVIRAAVDSGAWDVVLTAYNFRQAHRNDVRDAIAAAAGAGLGILAMKTQAGVYWDARRSRKINMAAALKWVLRDPNVHTTIPAFSNHDELAEDLATMNDLTMTPAEERDLGIGQAAAQDGLFCQQCGRCVPQCPARLEIPVLMRSYMYWVGHQRPQQARHTLRAWTVADVPCSGCDVCRVRCAMGFDVRRRALDVAQLLSA